MKDPNDLSEFSLLRRLIWELGRRKVVLTSSQRWDWQSLFRVGTEKKALNMVSAQWTPRRQRSLSLVLVICLSKAPGRSARYILAYVRVGFLPKLGGRPRPHLLVVRTKIEKNP